MLDWILNKLLQLALDGFKTANIAPADVGNFDDGFAKSRWIRLGQSEFEVFVGHCKLIHDLGIDDFLVDVDEIHLSSDLLERGFAAKSGLIGTDAASGLVCTLENFVRSVKIIWS